MSKETQHNIQVYKNRGAKAAGYKDWNELVTLLSDKTIGESKNTQFNYAIELAIEAAMKDRKTLDALFESIKEKK